MPRVRADDGPAVKTRAPRERDERRMTFIVVPHGGDSRSYEFSYRKLRLVLLGGSAAGLMLFLMIASWFWVAAQAARVPVLQHQITGLQREGARVEQLSRMVARLEAQYQQVRILLGGDAPRDTLPSEAAPEVVPPEPAATADSPQAALPRDWPLEQRNPWFITRGVLGSAGTRHPGVDIAVAAGSAIHATGAGLVLEAREDSVLGQYVRIGHAEGYESVYAHASHLLVGAHQRVQRDQVIALSGNSGVSTAPHLHFEIRKDGNPVDPQTLLHLPR